MTTRPPVLGLTALACLALAAPARGAGAASAVTIDGVRLGEQVAGQAVAPDDLRGRVVLLEFWGLH